MFLWQITKMALRALRTNLLRSLMATLGVIIGVGAVVAAVSILEGAERGILSSFDTLGADQLLIFNGQRQRGGRMNPMPSLLPSDADAIERENPEVVAATAPQYQSGGQIKYLTRNAYVGVLGTTQAYETINSYHVEHGRFLSREDRRGQTMVVVLGHKVASTLFGALPAVGKRVKINAKSFIVVGVMEEKGVLGFVEVDNQVILPLSTLMGRMVAKKYLTTLVVQCRNPRRLPACIERVTRTLRGAHRLKAGEPDDFQIFTQDQIKGQVAQAARIFAVVFYSIAGISLVVGGIGIMNIMLVSVTERTREIGVRIAVGARRSDVLAQFLLEAIIISTLGGALGVACGWTMATLLSNITQAFDAYTHPVGIAVALLMASLVGIISGIYPAVRAAHLDPVQALRFE